MAAMCADTWRRAGQVRGATGQIGIGACSHTCSSAFPPLGHLVSTYCESGTALVAEVATVNKLLPSESSQSVGRQEMK